MAKEKTVSDEQIAAALIETGSQKAAAAALNISERTIYNRLSDGNFQAVYGNAKNEVLRTAVSGLNKQINAAVQTITDIMQDNSSPANTRLQAAKTILDNAAKFSDLLSNNEGRVSMQIECNNDPLGWLNK